jgi:hypothetical protein
MRVMTREQHIKRIRQIAFELEKADHGMGMPRDYQRVQELREALKAALKEAELDMILAEFKS